MMMKTIDDAPSITRPAGFWRRLCAGLFDVLFLGTAALVLLLEISMAISLAESCGWSSPDTPETELILWTVLGLVWVGTSVVVLPILYYTLAEGAFGQTIGKVLFGIVVVSDDGRPISYGRAFVRFITLPYALVPAGIGLFWAVLPPAKRAWHDYISATRLISTV